MNGRLQHSLTYHSLAKLAGLRVLEQLPTLATSSHSQ
jgi:hypothetical protein